MDWLTVPASIQRGASHAIQRVKADAGAALRRGVWNIIGLLNAPSNNSRKFNRKLQVQSKVASYVAGA
jgi:hypothetical protein